MTKQRILLSVLILFIALGLLLTGWIFISRAHVDARLFALLNEGAGLQKNDFKNELDRSRQRINRAFDRQGKSLLDLAAEKGLRNEALLLLLAGADPNLKDAAGQTPIYFTVHFPTFDQAVVRDLLLLRGAKLDGTDRDHMSPLMTAVKLGDLKSVGILLRWGADPHPPPPEGDQLLQLAQERFDPRIKDLLHNYVAEPAQTKLKRSPSSQSVQDAFVAAARRGDIPGMKALLQQGATPDGPASDRALAIDRAISYQQVDAVVYLLHLGADPNIRDNRSYPPLSYTFGWHGDDSDYMQMALIAAGARTDMVQNTGYNLLADAVSHENEGAIQWMIWTGNDPSKACPAGTPMLIASRDGLDRAVKILQRNGVTEAPFSNSDPKWQMMRAVKAGDVAKVQQLLDKGAAVDMAITDSGDNGMMLAIAYRQLGVARFLLKHGSNPNYQNNGGDNPLRVSVGWYFDDNERFREELLEAGANPNLADKGGMTPFISACVYGNVTPKITQMVAHGADINLRDRAGHSGLYYAKRSGRTEAAEYLLQHGAKDDGS